MQFESLYLMLVSCDLIDQLNGRHFFECFTVLTRSIVGRVTLKKCHMREIYARTVRIEKPMAMAAVAAFLATS